MLLNIKTSLIQQLRMVNFMNIARTGTIAGTEKIASHHIKVIHGGAISR
jgi:hypothetical protein